MAIEPIKGFYVHDEVTDTDGVAKVSIEAVQEFEDDIRDETSNWLDDHPEATTTVLPDSLTTDKYKDGSVTLAKIKKGDLGYVTPEMFGAVGDGVTDDATAFNSALATGLPVWCAKKTYYVSSQLILNEGQELRGVDGRYASTVLKIRDGLKITGSFVSLRNIKLQGDDTGDYGLYCCGNNEGSSEREANYFSQNIVENVFISNYKKGIYFNAVVWDNKFTNIRIFRSETGIINTSTYDLFSTIFENVYIGGCSVCDVDLKRSTCTFVACNFGISANRCMQLSQSCNITIENSNFECDTFIEHSTTSPLIEITGKCLKFTGCLFKMSTSNNISFLATGAAVESVVFENCNYISVTLGQSNDMQRFLLTSITGANYGCISFENGCQSIPVNIETTYRIPYGKYPYVRRNNLLQAYSESDITTANLNKGDMVYFYQNNTIKYYNGTALV